MSVATQLLSSKLKSLTNMLPTKKTMIKSARGNSEPTAKMNAHNNLASYPETTWFLEWYSREKKKGLQDVKFFPRNVEGATVESFFKEVNEAIRAKPAQHHEFF